MRFLFVVFFFRHFVRSSVSLRAFTIENAFNSKRREKKFSQQLLAQEWHRRSSHGGCALRLTSPLWKK